jgi:hypothetical protein
MLVRLDRLLACMRLAGETEVVEVELLLLRPGLRAEEGLALPGLLDGLEHVHNVLRAHGGAAAALRQVQKPIELHFC